MNVYNDKRISQWEFNLMYSLPSYDDVWNNKYQTVVTSLVLQKNATNSKQYTGMGFISFADHQWDFQATCGGGITVESFQELMNRKPTLLIGSDEHYTLLGETSTTTPILCQDAYPSRNDRSEGVSNFTGILPYVVFGDDLENWRKGNIIRATFRDLNDWNNRLRLSRDKCGKIEVPSWCRFVWGGNEFSIIPSEDLLTLRISNDNVKFDGNILSHLQDVCCYCFGNMQSLRTYESVRVDGADRVRRIAHFSEKDTQSGSARTPLQSKRHAEHKAELFRHASLYLQYCMSHTTESDQLATHIVNVYRAFRVSPSLAALSLCVAIEWMAKTWCPDEHCVTVDDEVISKIKQSINWEDINTNNEEQMKNRFNGLLGMWESPSAKDRLNVLVQRGVITIEQYKTWDKARHTPAHGGLPELDYNHAKQMGELHDLMHSIIAWRIGYSGPLATYAVEGFPARDYKAPGYPLQLQKDS